MAVESVTAEQIASLLRTRSFVTVTEAQLQRGVASTLADFGVPFEREFPLGALSLISDKARELGTVDFFHRDGGVGIELKTKGSAGAILEQLQRYAAAPIVREMLLLTTSRRHVAAFEGMWRVVGKPFICVRLSGGFL